MSYQQILDTINNKMDREVTLFNNEFERVLRIVEQLIGIKALSSDPLEFDRELQLILQEAGYYNLVNEFIDNSFDKNYAELIELLSLSGIALAFDEDDLEAIKVIKQLATQTFLDIGNQAANRLKQDLYKYNLSNLSRADLILNIQQSLRDTDLAKYSTTYADTALSDFQQQVIDNKIKEIADEIVYIYVGATPDKKIRDFCKCVIDKNRYYDKSEANKLKNDKRRKWNCRHTVMPIREDVAIDRGYIKGDFTC